MPLSDKKKAQTVINGVIMALRATKRATILANEVEAAIIAHDLASDFPAGAVTALRNWVTDLNNLNTQALLDAVIPRYVPTHTGKALPGEIKYRDEEEAY